MKVRILVLMICATFLSLVELPAYAQEADGPSYNPAISADGRFVAFESFSSNLVMDDTNGTLDVFVHDRETGETTRVSVSSDGAQGDGPSYNPAISADGRFVAFASRARNLVPDDTNNKHDIFVHDRETRETTRVSATSDGAQGDASSGSPAISADGRFVAFESLSSNLVPDDTNNLYDVFVHDRETGETTRVSATSDGAQGDGSSGSPAISADGRFVAFVSGARNLVPGDTNDRPGIFVHDRETGETTRVSVSSDGAQGDGSSASPAISADGRFVAFVSGARNLVPGDTNDRPDIFVHDQEMGETTRVSVSSGGVQGNDNSGGYQNRLSSISADGRFVAFHSLASNLVTDDTNDDWDAFIHDRQTGQTTRVSVSSDGEQADDNSGVSRNEGLGPAISEDGRFVAFHSGASNLVTDDTNNVYDVFVHDRETGHTTRVSVPSEVASSVP